MLARLALFKEEVGVFVVGILFNFCVLTVFKDDLLHKVSSSHNHIEYGYAFFKGNTSKQYILPKLQYSFNEDEKRWQQQESIAAVHDTVFYGMLIGLIWKVTGVPHLLFIQFLQILIFSCVLIFLYRIAFMYSESRKISFLMVLGVLAYVPLIFMNLIPIRDIWSFYGGVILIYVLLKNLERAYSKTKTFLAAVFFAVCQCMRPNLFFHFIVLIGIYFLYGLFSDDKNHKKSLLVIALCVFANIVVFWIPFMAYNIYTFGTCFVSVSGHGALAALASVKNPWGLEYGDGPIFEFVKKHYPMVQHRTLDYNSKAKELFFYYNNQQPLVYVRAVIKSFKQAFFSNLPSCWLLSSRYEAYFAFKGIKKLESIYVQGGLFELVLFLLWYCSRFSLLFGYLGALYGLISKHFKYFVFIFLSTLLGMCGLLFSHCEVRYVIPYFWLFPFFSVYFFCSIFFYGKRYTENILLFIKNFVVRKV